MDTSASFHTTPYHGHQHHHHLDSNPSQGVTFTSRASSAAAAAAAAATTSPPTTATASRPTTVRSSSRLSRRYGRTLAFSGERSGRKMRRLATGTIVSSSDHSRTERAVQHWHAQQQQRQSPQPSHGGGGTTTALATSAAAPDSPPLPQWLSTSEDTSTPELEAQSELPPEVAQPVAAYGGAGFGAGAGFEEEEEQAEAAEPTHYDSDAESPPRGTVQGRRKGRHWGPRDWSWTPPEVDPEPEVATGGGATVMSNTNPFFATGPVKEAPTTPTSDTGMFKHHLVAHAGPLAERIITSAARQKRGLQWLGDVSRQVMASSTQSPSRRRQRVRLFRPPNIRSTNSSTNSSRAPFLTSTSSGLSGTRATTFSLTHTAGAGTTSSLRVSATPPPTTSAGAAFDYAAHFLPAVLADGTVPPPQQPLASATTSSTGSDLQGRMLSIDDFAPLDPTFVSQI